ncbi:hypothetical protein DRQ50_09480 [bacterium]|nr:MAG: hypothetical protein DRQ50_09480 [bacterium]
MQAATDPILIIRYLPSAGDAVTEFLHLHVDGTSTLFSKHEHGGLKQLGPPDMPTIMRTAAAAGINRCIVDLSAVSWMNSTGVGMLVGWFQAARAAGSTLVFAAVNSAVTDLFKVTKLDTVFTVFPTVAAAAAHLCGTGDKDR